MKKLLITGASGFLGYNFLQTDLSRWQVFVTVHQRPISATFVQPVQCDLTNNHSIQQVLTTVRPDAIVHLAAWSNALFCEQQPGISYQVNLHAPLLIAQWCKEADIPFIFTSTDLVFDGTKGNYTEKDPVNPLSLYGKQKSEAEKGISDIHPKACILRMPLMFGYGGQYGQSFIQGFLRKLRQGEKLRLFTDEYRSIVGGQSAAKGIWLALEHEWKGIYHMGGKKSMSRYDFGVLLCATTGILDELIVPSLQKEVPMMPARPSDVSLNSDKAYKKGYDPMPVETELRLLAQLQLV
jgi:dTDP-4-dehydrorhamnose reductase